MQELIAPQEHDIFSRMCYDVKNDEFSLGLVDGDIITMTREDLIDAFALLTSDKFSDLVAYIKERDALDSDRTTKYQHAKEEKTNTAIYDACINSCWYGEAKVRASITRDTLIEQWSWNTWIDACRLYETLFGIDRSELA